MHHFSKSLSSNKSFSFLSLNSLSFVSNHYHGSCPAFPQYTCLNPYSAFSASKSMPDSPCISPTAKDVPSDSFLCIQPGTSCCITKAWQANLWDWRREMGTEMKEALSCTSTQEGLSPLVSKNKREVWQEEKRDALNQRGAVDLVNMEKNVRFQEEVTLVTS